MADDADFVDEPEQKCPECEPGLPGWMATFSDLITLLLTFFVLLLSMSKTETAKYEAALGSIRNSFGGNVFKHGEVIQKGKSPDNSPTMLESQEPIKPFPIDFLTMEGILDKHEINRESDEDLDTLKNDLNQFNLAEEAEIYEMPEGIKVKIKDKILFEKGGITPSKISAPVIKKMLKLLKNKDWAIFVVGHASRGEEFTNSKDKSNNDAFSLSAARASAVARTLIKDGVRPDKVTTVFYGDTRPDKVSGDVKGDPDERQRRVEFIIRKTDLTAEGHKVESR
jgi:chemotaxis protein MotB